MTITRKTEGCKSCASQINTSSYILAAKRNNTLGRTMIMVGYYEKKPNNNIDKCDLDRYIERDRIAQNVISM